MPVVRVVALEAADATPAELPGSGLVSAAELVHAAGEGLRSAGVEVDLSAGQLRRGDFRLRLELLLQHVPPSADTDQRGLLRALCRGRLQALSEGPPLEIARLDQEAVAEKVYRGPPPGRSDWVAHARRTARDTAAALGRQVRLLSADRATLLGVLRHKDSDNDLRMVAMQILGARRDREALPALFEMLKHPDMEVRDRAIGALIEIGDRRAVKALASSAQFSDTFELGKILEAVATLGGPEARSYLEFVASGHQSEQIRAEARVALSHLERRERDGGAQGP